MVQALRRTTVRGATFIRLLARLTEVDPQPSGQSLPDRLGQWLDWTRSIALAAALEGERSEAPSDMPTIGRDEEEEYARVRAALTHAITDDREWIVSEQRASHAVSKDDGVSAAIDYTIFRQRYLSLQLKMHRATVNLRITLRNALARKTADMARLAAADAVMEFALNPREQKSLAAVPELLAQRFERLRQAELETRTDADAAANTTAARNGAWLNVFRKDMQSVLLAELDVRFQPVEGLLAALRTCQLESHV